MLVKVIHKSWEKSCNVSLSPNEGYVTAGPKPGCVNPRVGCGKSSDELVAAASASPTASPTATPTDTTTTTKLTLGAYNTLTAMPTQPDTPQQHRQKLKEKLFCALGARRVFAPEIKKTLKAQQAMREEFQRLSKQDTFDWKSVIEASQLRNEARSGRRKKVHIGLVLGYVMKEVIY